MHTFKTGDRVVRNDKPHTLSGEAWDGEPEAATGDAGTVLLDWGDGDYSVEWDRDGFRSCLGADGLDHAPETASS